jgi:hypothetical protein
LYWLRFGALAEVVALADAAQTQVIEAAEAVVVVALTNMRFLPPANLALQKPSQSALAALAAHRSRQTQQTAITEPQVETPHLAL